jgi:hypothetical protein
MTTQKRFSTTAIVTYRLSSSTKVVSFDTLEEAIQLVKNEKSLHPRSKKFNPTILDSVTKTRVNGLYL